MSSVSFKWGVGRQRSQGQQILIVAQQQCHQYSFTLDDTMAVASHRARFSCAFDRSVIASHVRAGAAVRIRWRHEGILGVVRTMMPMSMSSPM